MSTCIDAQERCAYTTSDDWAIFALHNQYVRPLRDREWVPGEPCIIRKDSFELPPGACECKVAHFSSPGNRCAVQNRTSRCSPAAGNTRIACHLRL